MIRVLLDDAPLHDANAIRGVGTYTRLLAQYLQQQPSLELTVTSWKIVDTSNFDLIHFPYFDLFATTLPMLKTPIVVTVHDVIPLQFSNHYPPGIKGRTRLWKQRLSLRFAHQVITDSQASREQIAQHLSYPLEKITVVPLAGDPSLIDSATKKKTSSALTARLPAAYILYVGDINYNKNLPQLIKSLKYLPDSVELVLVGSNFQRQQIPEWHAIEQQISLSDVTGRVRFLPDIKMGDYASLLHLYQHATCYVQPSLAEGFGLPVLDALGIGCPVVCSQVSSLPEVGGTAVTYCQPEAESIARGINHLLDLKPAQRADVIKFGKARAAHFSWGAAAQQTAQVYSQVVRQSSK